jgi:hypothetical protein
MSKEYTYVFPPARQRTPIHPEIPFTKEEKAHIKFFAEDRGDTIPASGSHKTKMKTKTRKHKHRKHTSHWIHIGSTAINLSQVSHITRGTFVWKPQKRQVKAGIKAVQAKYFHLCGFVVREDVYVTAFTTTCLYMARHGWNNSQQAMDSGQGM